MLYIFICFDHVCFIVNAIGVIVVRVRVDLHLLWICELSSYSLLRPLMVGFTNGHHNDAHMLSFRKRDLAVLRMLLW